MKLKEFLNNPNTEIDEVAYPGNLGVMELSKFYKVASKKQKDTMAKIIKERNWDEFKKLIKNVLGVKLV